MIMIVTATITTTNAAIFLFFKMAITLPIFLRMNPILAEIHPD